MGRCLQILAIALFLVAGAYIGKGYLVYFHQHVNGLPSTIGGCDARARWREEQYVLRGQDPYDVFLANSPKVKLLAYGAELLSPRNESHLNHKLGLPYDVVYPPWTYGFGVLIFALPKSALSLSYAVLMACGLTAICIWAYRLGSEQNRWTGLLLAASSIAISGWCGAIFTGNFPAIVVPLLIAALVSLESEMPVLAGCLLAMAMIKPSLAAPFGLVLLIRGEYRAIFSGLVVGAISSAFTWIMTGVTPWWMLRQMVGVAGLNMGKGDGLVPFLVNLHLSPQTACWTAAIVGLTFALVGLLAARHQPLLIQFAIVAFAVRLWTYHFAYDNGVMVFMIVVTGIAAVRRGTLAMWAAFVACGATLWLPASLLDKHPVQLMQYVIWTVLACALVRRGNHWIQPKTAATADAVQTPAVLGS